MNYCFKKFTITDNFSLSPDPVFSCIPLWFLIHISFLILPLFCFLPDDSANNFTHPHPTALLLAFLCHHVQTRVSFHPFFRAVTSQSHPFVSRPFVLLFCSYVDVVLVFRSCRITGGVLLQKTETTPPRTLTGLRFPELSADQGCRSLNYKDRVPFNFCQNAKSDLNYMECQRKLHNSECIAFMDVCTIFILIFFLL